MIHKNVFRSKKKISCIGIGALHFGSFTDQKEAKKIVDYSISNGINYFDTSPMYGNTNSEKILGSIFKEKRKKIMIGTKIGLKTVGQGKNSKAVSLKLNKSNITNSIDNSLKSLKTDYIDYFQLHYFDEKTPLLETLQILENEKKRGRILNVGICNYEKKNLIDLFKQGDISNIVSGIHCHYNIIERRFEKELMNLVIKKRMTFLSFQAFARGFLTGKYSPTKKILKNTRAYNSRRFERFFKKEMFESLERIKSLGKKYNCSLKEIAITWLINKSYLNCAVLGFRNLKQTKEIISIVNNKINKNTQKEVDNLIMKDIYLSKYIYNIPNPFMEY